MKIKTALKILGLVAYLAVLTWIGVNITPNQLFILVCVLVPGAIGITCVMYISGYITKRMP